MVDVGEGRLSYDISDLDGGHVSDLYYLNLTKDLSWLNSKNYEHTTRDGHVYGYLVDFTFVDQIDPDEDWDSNEFFLAGAPNTWKMRNAFRKFHFHRLEMFKDVGVTREEMGKYGRTIRPYLSEGMVDITVDAGAPVVYSEHSVLSPIGATDANRE